MTEDWTKWENLVINGVFPLRGFLGRSNHSVVFRTEHKSTPSLNAAIKLIPADPTMAPAQLACWKAVATLSHPHLIRLLDSGRCQLGRQQFIFVAMEYAEETLAQILPHRALTPDEVRDLLLPTLDALAFLHRKNLVHGQLKPPNFLVIGDQVKLASDNIRPAGQPRASIATSLYDPPEAKDGRITTAGDIWGLGMVIVEALTQFPPRRRDQESDTVSLPATLPATYLDFVRRCLSLDPARRPTVSDLEAQFKPAKQAPVPVPQAAGRQAPARAPQKSASGRLFVAGFAGGLILLVAIWLGLRSFSRQSDSPPPASRTSPTSPTGQASLQPAVPPAAVSPNPAPPISAPASVLHEEIPEVSHSARESIRGRIKVSVRVNVDRAGNVVGATLEGHGSSKYFARLATEAARKWKFAPASDQASRAWLLRFEFTRGGAAGHAVSSRP